MHCLRCKAGDTRVIDSRVSKDGFLVIRKRKCLKCHYQFTTREESIDPPILIKKNRKQAEPFNSAKIKEGIEKACKNLPVSPIRIYEMAKQVEEQVLALGELEIGSRQIGDFVYEELRKENLVAAFNFARVYKKLKTLEELKEVFDQLLVEREEKNQRKKKNEKFLR